MASFDHFRRISHQPTNATLICRPSRWIEGFGPDAEAAPFDQNQSFLDRDSWSTVGFAGESSEPIAADDSMAGGDDRLWISPHRLSDGSGRTRMTGQGGEVEVGSDLTSRDAPGRPPHRSLEGGPRRKRDIAEIRVLPPQCPSDLFHHHRRWWRIGRRGVEGLPGGRFEHVDPSRRDRVTRTSTNVEVAGRRFQNEMGSGAHAPTLAVSTSVSQRPPRRSGRRLFALHGNLH